MNEATYFELMEEGYNAERRGDLEAAHHLFSLALETPREDGGPPLGAFLKKGLTEAKIAPGDAKLSVH
ncbi:MAG: hypothetical protein NXH97_18225 [Rhodobacteraceae bacterium]|nr:hypothetical protein [Paracoccaceae bacterium]